MTNTLHSKIFRIGLLSLCTFLWLANNSNPPNGRTGAPFDGTCGSGSCHGMNNNNNYNGTISLSGLPATIEANTTYNLSFTVTVTAGTPVKAGFQLVAVSTSTNSNAGDFVNTGTETGTEVLAGREYIEHRNGKAFSGGSVTWTFNWTSPVTVSGNNITFYYIANFVNGNGNSTGDFPLSSSSSFAFNGLPPVSAVISSSNNSSCFGANNGSATVTASGGVAPYTYQWSNNATTATVTGLVAGTYTVTVTGASGSGTATASTVITQPPAIIATVGVSGPITCLNTTATATCTVNGGVAPYTFQWSDGQVSNPAVFNNPGSYLVTITDNNGCTKTVKANISSNTTPPIAVANTTGPITCVNPTASLNCTGSSSGANIQYQWTTTNGNILSGSNSCTAVANAVGTYTLKVTILTNGCTSTAQTTVVSSVSPPGATASGGVITCSNPSVTLSASSPTGGVIYAWTGPANFNSYFQNPVVTSAGTYTVVVTNPENGCASTATAVVTLNTDLPTAAAVAGNALTCLQTTTTVGAVTNAATPAYLWQGPAGFTSNLQNPQVSFPGSYQLTVTNLANGCTNTAAATVSQNITAPGATATGGTINCINGSVVLTGMSGVGQATYGWTGPNNYLSSSQNPVVSTAGVYVLTTTDTLNGCTSTATADVLLNTIPPIAVATAPGNLNCNNAALTLSGAGSSTGPPFVYLWTTPDGNIVSDSSTLEPVVDEPGLYILLITNSANGCSAMDSVQVLQAAALTLAGNVGANVSCYGGNNGQASVAASGGEGTYNYLWSNGFSGTQQSGLLAGAYTITVTDAAGCTTFTQVNISQPDILVPNATSTAETASGANDGTATSTPSGGTPGYDYTWSNGASSTNSIVGLAPGSYTVTVTDQNGCTAVQSLYVASFDCTLGATLNVTPVLCSGGATGAVSVLSSGGTPPYSYTWSNGGSGSGITGLTSGVYTVTVADAAACVVIEQATVLQPSALQVSSTTLPVACPESNNGFFELLVSGGTPPYGYSYQGTNGQLSVGTYVVTVADAVGCLAQHTVQITSNDQQAPEIVCPANIQICGADLVEYALPIVTDNCNLGPNPLTLLSGQPSGTAFTDGVTVQYYQATDASGKKAVCSFSVTVFPVPDVGFLQIENDVNNTGVGSIKITPLGSTGPYTYEWRKDGVIFSNLEDLSGLFAGVYTLRISDVNGCTADLAPIVISNTVGTLGLADGRSFLLVPNPAQGYFRLLTEDSIGDTRALVYDIQGRVVLQLNADDLSDKIDIQELERGVYHVRVIPAGRKEMILRLLIGE